MHFSSIARQPQRQRRPREVKHLDLLLSPELDREPTAQNIISLIAGAVTIVDHVTKTEAVLETTGTTTIAQLDEAEAGIATATVTETKESVATMTTGIEDASPMQWTTTRGHALGSVLRDAHAHDHPRASNAAVAHAHLHALVPTLGARDLEALVPIGRMAKHMALKMTSSMRLTSSWTMQEHMPLLRTTPTMSRRKVQSA